MRTLRGLKDPLLFGKYRDLNIKQIYHKDPSYVRWLYRDQVLMYTSPSSQERFREMATKRTVKWAMGLGKSNFDPDFEPDVLNALIASVCKRKDEMVTVSTPTSILEDRMRQRRDANIMSFGVGSLNSEHDLTDCEMAQEFDLRADYCGDR